MPSQDLKEAYERFRRKERLYTEAIRSGRIIWWVGFSIFLLSVPGIIPAILKSTFGIDPFLPWYGGILFGFAIMIIGKRLEVRVPLPPDFSSSSVREFFKVYEALENLEEYIRSGFEISRCKAVELFSELERSLYSPEPSRLVIFWYALTKDSSEELNELKHNLRGRVIPILERGEKEKIRKAYWIFEELARCFLNPSLSKLREVNTLLVSELPQSVQELGKEPKFLFFKQFFKRYWRHVLVILLIALSACGVFYFGTNYFGMSDSEAYQTAVLFLGAIIGGSIAMFLASKSSK